MDTSIQPVRYVVGVMTGTSIDGIDAALVRIDGLGFDMRGTLIRHIAESLGDLQPRLRAAAHQQPMTAGDFARLAWEFGVLHAKVIQRLVADQPQPTLICVHGQTVFHHPPVSWQLLNPAPIAAGFNCPIVSDLRQADLAHGGQGAPITPIADWILFRDESKRRAIVNLGGFCNMTILPADGIEKMLPTAGGNPRNLTTDMHAIRGFDVCACNQLLDTIAREALGKSFDEDGECARRGVAKPRAVDALRAILDRQRRSGRSLGTGDEATQWIAHHQSMFRPNDLAASAVDAIAQTIIAAATEHDAGELILAGGGARNRALRDAMARLTAKDSLVRLADELGVPIDAREAMCFAILGALCQDSMPITLPAVTGLRTHGTSLISGQWSNPTRPQAARSNPGQ